MPQTVPAQIEVYWEENYMKKTKKKVWKVVVVILLILAVLIVGMVSCSKKLMSSMLKTNNMITEAADVEKRDISEYISASGSVESENMVKITSTLTAKVKSLNVEIGSEVKEGDVLLEFDSADLQQQYDALKKTIENSDSLSSLNHSVNERNLTNAKNEKEFALAAAQRAIDEAISVRDRAYAKETELTDRVNSLIGIRDDLYSQANGCDDPEMYAELFGNYQEAEMEVQSAQAQLDELREQLSGYDSAVKAAEDSYRSAEKSADAAIQSCQDILDAERYNQDNSSQTELDKIADAIEECTVYAPKSGIVTSLNVAEGSIPTSDALMTIEDKNALKITVLISEADILKVHEGMSAVVTAEALGDKEFSAKVSRVVNIYKGGISDDGTGESSGGYSAEITIDDKDNEFLIGMNAKVKIILNEKKDVLSVPYESVVENEDGSSSVFLAVTDEASGITTAKKVNVEVGMTGTYFTEILSGDVKEGDKVVIDGTSCIDGIEINVISGDVK